jgi:hypothetical protein
MAIDFLKKNTVLRINTHFVKKLTVTNSVPNYICVNNYCINDQTTFY